MAKKSAASKGYRKTIKKKPFLTKNEIIILVVIVVAIIAGVVLFNQFYTDGYLKAGDVKPNDVVSTVSTKVGNSYKKVANRYQKVADANELEGFTRTNEYRDINPASDFTYTPDEPIDNISSLVLGGSYLNADELTDNNISMLESFNSSDSFVISERTEVTVQGHEAYVFNYTSNYYQAPDGEAASDEETPESNVFYQNISLYVNADDNRSVCFRVLLTGEDDSYYMTDEEAVDYILGYADRAFIVYELPEEAA